MPMTLPKTSPKTSPMPSRTKVLCACAAALILAMVGAIAPATAQFPAAPDDRPAAKGKKGAAGAPTINGNWTGELTQVGSQTPYKFELAITGKGAETKYPDLDCIGKLTRVPAHRRPIPSSSKSSPRARPTKAAGVPMAP